MYKAGLPYQLASHQTSKLPFLVSIEDVRPKMATSTTCVTGPLRRVDTLIQVCVLVEIKTLRYGSPTYIWI